MATSFFDDPRQLAPRRVTRTELPGGGFVLRSPEPLAPHARTVGAWLERWASETPDALAFAEPDAAGGWVRLSWGALRHRVGCVAQALLNLQLGHDRPVVVLSDNSLDHWVLLLAGQHIGHPVCTVSSAYSRLAGADPARLQAILRALHPGLVYAHDATTYGAAMVSSRQAVDTDTRWVLSHGSDALTGAMSFADLVSTVETPAVMKAHAEITPETPAKYLLTSGSTGTPKVVINTHGMLTANQQMLAQTLRFLDHSKPVLLDWLPWSHTFGGNHNANLVLRTGGTMYIDDGRPMPGLIDKTVAHLRDVQPTLYFNVPRGYDMLLPALERDPALAAQFFGQLQMLFYAGSGMPASTWQRLKAASAAVRDTPLWMTTSWGSTETAPAITFAHWHLEQAGVIGLPMPGVELKFVPSGDKLEMRVRGPNIFPGYRGNPEATAQAFDDEGYYCIGDAGLLADPDDPSQGVVFNGRVAEDFKLTSGTWVSVGNLRLKLVTALAPLAQDVVVTGHDRPEVGALVFLSEAARQLSADELRLRIRRALEDMAGTGAGSSQTPTRLCLLPDAPNAAAGEITDKGYLNQRLVLSRRAEAVDRLYAATPGSAGADTVLLKDES